MKVTIESLKNKKDTRLLINVCNYALDISRYSQKKLNATEEGINKEKEVQAKLIDIITELELFLS
jgi:hypothetical protein